MAHSAESTFGIVAIGRNEGDRLKRCLRSLPAGAPIVYVDSGSSDGSDQWARGFGAEVVQLDLSTPFTAARARNAGFRRLSQLNRDLLWVQFVDGDCELASEWPDTAISFLQGNAKVAAVFGRRRERAPDRSVYNRLCDWEWDGPAGDSRACGGDVMIRSTAFQEVGGYRDLLIAGEEPELCVRLRAAGWRIVRLDAEMTWHDAAMTRFSQWWKRTLRSGYAFAEGAYLHGAPPERHWVWESRRAWIWGVFLPILCVAAGIALMPWGWVSFAIYPLQMIRQSSRGPGDFRERATKAFFQVIGRFPEALGQLQFWRDRLFSRKSLLIEYK
ncbi:glycosyltransferase [Bradyrhizobium sp. dw_78]|uniref:glycosyltransferase n=1 Tax=Bradyrhizobium sp. dw_78 TaxID=2719793 RepID=UPI00320AB11A